MLPALVGCLSLVPLPAAAQQRSVGVEEALRTAYEHSRELLDAWAQFNNAEAQVDEAWGSVMPTLDLNASYTRNLAVPLNFLPATIFDPDADPDALVGVKFGSDNLWNLQLRAEQPLFDGAAIIGLGAAQRYRSLQREMVRGRAADITAAVRLAYYDVLLASEAFRLSQNTVERIRQTLTETQKMNAAGLASDYDVLRLEVELANVEPNLLRARNALAAAERGLAVRMGLDAIDSLRVEGNLAALDDDITQALDGPPDPAAVAAALTADLPDAQEAVGRALELRSDLRQLRLTESLRRTELAVERSGYLPRVALFGTYAINAQQNGDPAFFGDNPEQRSFARSVGLQVSVPLFSGLQRPAREAQTKAVIRQVEAQTALLAVQIENEVRTLLDEVWEAAERRGAQRKALAQAERGYQIARTQYREGISSPLEVTDAEVALRQSEFNYAQAVYDFMTARVRLDKAMGVAPLLGEDGTVTLDMGTES
jgi:outer membrane protein TolC